MIRMIVKATIYYYELQCLFLINIVLIISYITTNLLREVIFLWSILSDRTRELKNGCRIR